MPKKTKVTPKFLAPPLEAYREQAAQVVMRKYATLAARDGRPPEQRAFDATKYAEALMMLDPKTSYASELIVEEARIRSEVSGTVVDPISLAESIRAAGGQFRKQELDRVSATARIQAAVDHAGILAVLEDEGVEVTNGSRSLRPE